jgi:hypothetical protein
MGRAESVLFVHETHEVIGRKEEEFEAAIRDEWMPTLAKTDNARLLWYAVHIHGTGPAYNFLTITAVRDGAALEELARRLYDGDLAQWQTLLDALRHGVTSSTMLPVPWSPMQTVDLDGVPTGGEEHEPSIYMEDTGWPTAALKDYVRFWGSGYHEPMQARPRADRLLDIEACFQPAYGAGRRKEAVLWQKVLDHDRLLHLLTDETPPERKLPGTFMHEALAYRDQWRSRLFRTSRWSPLG